MAKAFTLDELKEAAVAIKEMNEQLGIGMKNDPSTTVVTGAPAHGPGGLFSAAGYKPQMWATIPRPVNTLMGRIPLTPSRYVNEKLQILTGLTATEGNAANDWCTTGAQPGQLKRMAYNISWGELNVSGRVMRIPDLGQLKNYADLPVDVYNLQMAQGQFIPQLPSGGVNSDVGKKIIELGLSVERSVELIDARGVAGAKVNTADYNLWQKQYAGLEALVKTGYADVDSGVAAPAADSLVVAFNATITGNGANGADFVTNVVDLIYALRYNADALGLNVQWAIVVNPKLWRAIAYQWACAYYTTFCAGSAGNPIVQESTAIAAIRDEMMRNRVLMVDGEPVEVLFSTGIEASGNGNNVFNSDLYVLPLYINGVSTLYHQFFPMDNPEITSYIASGVANVKIINGGLYFLGHQNTPACDIMQIMARVRLVLEAPFMAARLNDIQFTYRAQTLDPRPGESNYKNGGQSSFWSQTIT